MPIEVIVTPIWTAEMYSLMLPSCSSASAAPRSAFLAHQLKARPPRAHERVLGDHEEGVDRDQHGREDELGRSLAPGGRYFGKFFVVVIVATATVARGGRMHGRRASGVVDLAASSKSASVRPPSEWVERVRRTLFQPCTRMSG